MSTPTHSFTAEARAIELNNQPVVAVWSDGVMFSADNGKMKGMPGLQDSVCTLEAGKRYRISIEEVKDEGISPIVDHAQSLLDVMNGIEQVFGSAVMESDSDKRPLSKLIRVRRYNLNVLSVTLILEKNPLSLSFKVMVDASWQKKLSLSYIRRQGTLFRSVSIDRDVERLVRLIQLSALEVEVAIKAYQKSSTQKSTDHDLQQMKELIVASNAYLAAGPVQIERLEHDHDGSLQVVTSNGICFTKIGERLKFVIDNTPVYITFDPRRVAQVIVSLSQARALGSPSPNTPIL